MMKNMTWKQFPTALSIQITALCGSVRFVMQLVFGNFTEAAAAINKVDSTLPAVMSANWYGNFTQIVSTSAATFDTIMIFAPPPLPPFELPQPPPIAPPMPPQALEAGEPFAVQVTRRVNVAMMVAIGSGAVASIIGVAFTAAGGGARGGTAGASAFGDGSGGNLMPLLFGAQRFACSTGMGVGTSDLQSGVASSLGWASGEVPFFPSPVSPVERRRLNHPSHSTNATGSTPPMPTELVTLYNLLMTTAIAITFTFALQGLLALYFRRVLNYRYYRHRRLIATASRKRAKNLNQAAMTKDLDVGPERIFCGLCGPTRKMKPPKFFPFPKSLVWPTPFFFATCMFITGLTRASVRLLATDTPDCGALCYVLPITVLAILTSFITITAGMLLTFRRKHGSEIKFKPAARPLTPSKVGDPYMRLRAKLRVHILSLGMVAADRTSSLSRESSWSSRSSRASSRSASVLPYTGVHPTPTPVPGYRSRPTPPPSPPDADGAETRDAAAISLQTSWRCKLARTALQRRRSQMELVHAHNRAARVVQGAYRQRKARALVMSLKVTAERERAAMKLQKMARNRNARKLMRPWIMAWRHGVVHTDVGGRSSGVALVVEGVRGRVDMMDDGGAVIDVSAASVDRHIDRMGSRSALASAPAPAANAPAPAANAPAPAANAPAPAASAPASDLMPAPALHRCSAPELTAQTTPAGRAPAPEQIAEIPPHQAEMARRVAFADIKPREGCGADKANVTNSDSSAENNVAASMEPTPQVYGDDAKLTSTPNMDETATPSRYSEVQRRRIRRTEARQNATDRLAAHGHRDRKTGGWGAPEDDTKEPERSERLLANPFRFHHARAGDRWQSIEGYLLFRVNGSSRIATCYRLIVIGVNMIFGILSGIQPLLPPQSMVAIAQTSMFLSLQLGMSYVCFRFLPDADRIVSRFAGTQFFVEGLSTAFLLSADGRMRILTSMNATAVNDTDGDSLGTAEGSTNNDDVQFWFLDAGFVLSLTAISVPVVQMLEQRFVTPVYNLLLNRGANPLVLLAAAYMMVASLPRMLRNLISSAEDGAKGSAEMAASASADAGDEGATEKGDGGGAGADGEPCEEGHENEEVCDCPSDEEVEISGDMVADAGARVSRLLARAIAAKEVASKSVKQIMPPPIPEVDEAPSMHNMHAVRGVARMMRSRSTRRNKAHDHAAEDDGDDGDGGGGDM